MDATDGQVPAPRRPALPLFRRPAPTGPTALPFAVPGDEQAPRVADLSALLGEIDALRLSLQTDLTLAAAALEEGAPDLAAELVDGDLHEVRAFAARADERLARLEAGADLPLVTPLRRRRVLSAAPLMAAAAAIIGFVAFSPGRPATSSPDTTMTSAAIAGFELSRLASEGAPDEELAEAAAELNDELAVLIAQAAEDPAAAQQALLLLERTTQVLAGQGQSGVLAEVIAETRALRERLRDTLPAVKRPGRPAVRSVLPALPRVQQQPEKRESTSPKSSPKPAASSPKPTTAPAPTQAPEQPEPTAPPAEEPTPQPTQGGGPLPGYDGDGLPGV